LSSTEVHPGHVTISWRVNGLLGCSLWVVVTDQRVSVR